MITAIAKTQYYDISADATKNRVYLTLSGFWPNKAAVPDYVNDITKSVQNLTPGFTILADMRAFKTVTEEIAELQKQVGGTLMRAGIGRTAEVIPQEMKIQQMAIENHTKGSGMARMLFHDVIEAEKWLDAGK